MTRSFRALCRLSTLAIVLAAMPPAARASDFTSNDLLIPILARTPGAYGSEWRTELAVTNVSHSSLLGTKVLLTFTQAGTGEQASMSSILVNGESLVLRDVLQDGFGLSNAAGTLRITGANPASRLVAHARIYNRASPAGEFGQGVPALPVDGLGREHYLTGLTGVGVNRSNVGVSNPWDIPVNFSVTLIDGTGEFRGAFGTAVGPRQVVQFNDIFAEFGTGPLQGATVRIMSTFGVYAYASVVRSDSGDGNFVMGTGFARGNSELAATGCSTAAPVNLVVPPTQPAEGWIVQLGAKETDPAGRAALLAQRHGFTIGQVFESSKSFHAALTASQLADLRCEAAVSHIVQNAFVPIP